VEKIASKILSLNLEHVQIEVQGHTDSSPMQGSKNFASNWELSAGRATAVVRYLIGRGVPARIFKATGFADQRPIVKERDGNGKIDVTAQRLNRRIEVRIVRKVPAVSPPSKSPASNSAPAPVK
jgi:chemotaxis protein MotB